MLRICAFAMLGVVVLAAEKPEPPEAKEFQKRIDAYMDLRRNAENEVPQARSSEDPKELQAHRDKLFQAIRGKRPTAAQGNIFSEPVAAWIRAELRRETAGKAGASAKETVKTGNPVQEGTPFVPKVNGIYPVAAPLSMVPAGMLERLPKLPKELEYRFVGKTLVLLDAAPRLIVDLIPKALP